MGDDAYEFLGPDLLAPPPPASGTPSTTPGTSNTPETKQPTNELLPVSAAQKFQVKPAPATASKTKSKSKESGEGKAKNKPKKREKKPKESEEVPTLRSLRRLIVLTGILIFISVAITLMVLIDGLT